jgi:hypothetical protein
MDFQEKTDGSGEIFFLNLEESRIPKASQAQTKSPRKSLRQMFREAKDTDVQFVALIRHYFKSGEYRIDAELTAEVLLWMVSNAPLTAKKYLGLYTDVVKVVEGMKVNANTDGKERVKNASLSERAIENLINDQWALPVELFVCLRTYFETNSDKEILKNQSVRLTSKLGKGAAKNLQMIQHMNQGRVTYMIWRCPIYDTSRRRNSSFKLWNLNSKRLLR